MRIFQTLFQTLRCNTVVNRNIERDRLILTFFYTCFFRFSCREASVLPIVTCPVGPRHIKNARRIRIRSPQVAFGSSGVSGSKLEE